MYAKLRIFPVIFFLHMTLVQAEPQITLNTEEYPPMNFTDPHSGEIVGIGTDIAREMMRRADIAYVLRMQPWNRAYDGALKTPNQCVFSTTHLEQRHDLFEWVEPLSVREWTVFALADSDIELTDFEDLRSYVVGGYAGDAKAIYLQDRGIQVETTTRDELNPLKLKMGRILLWAADRQMGHILAEQSGVAIRPVFTFHTIVMSIACNKNTDPDLLLRMRTAMASVHEDGTAAAIEARYQNRGGNS